MDNTKPVRPLVLELDDAREEIFAAINRATSERHIPFYLLENIVYDAARQVSEHAKSERDRIKNAYEIQLAEFEKARDVSED